jgi:hypothetical protein
MPIEFFALPEEQLPWLRELLSDPAVWCWVRLLGKGSRIIEVSEELDLVDFTSTDLIELDFGRGNVQDPVWEQTGYGVDLDFSRSLAVQFDPCLMIGGQELIKGQMAISPKGWYDFYGVNSESVVSWYKRLSKSWKKVFSREDMVVVDLEDGRSIPYRGVHLTAGSVAWWQSGKELKDALDWKFKYDVVPRASRKSKRT